uniref:Putative ferric-chelate reductase 1 n=1 Tax=Seriola lalandi dorsalis TaxID=1841481 RepID=A0A3B4X087_SERLL
CKTFQLQALGSTPFTGFLLQAREVGGQSPVGSFTLTSGATQLLTCSQRPVSFQPASFAQNFRTFWVSVTSPTVTFINNSTGGSETPPPSPTTTTDCGVTKVCFSQPSDCDPAVSADCYFMSAMMLSPSDAAVRYELTGPSDGYVSFGFSDDQMMGNDDIYVCGVGSDGLVRLQRVFSTGRTTPQAVPLVLTHIVISCCFTSMNSISTQRSTGLKNSYYLLFAHGPSSRGQIQFHTATFISTDKVHISRPQTIREAGQPPIIRAHGALMLTAWMTAGSLGMMVARYLRGMAKGQMLWGKDVWFLVHVVVMSVTTAATVIAFILPFSHVQTWSEGAHPVLGCLVMSFSFFQPILALLRCGPQHPLRYLFYWSHVLNALVIKALAVAAIFTGLKLIDSSPDQWLMKVMGGFVSWEVLFFILMEITADLLLVALFLLGNISFLVALLVGIGTS